MQKVYKISITFSGCPYVKEGRKAFREFIDVLKTWVFSECGESYEFSQLKCGCVLEGSYCNFFLRIEPFNYVEFSLLRTIINFLFQ